MENKEFALNLNRDSMKSLMQDFYLLTGIKIVIFDNSYREILSYPESHCLFCELMQSRESSLKKCMDSNRRSFHTCQKTMELEIYHCHAGLVEATAPLIDNGVILGYVMFGQISDNADFAGESRRLNQYLRANGFDFPQRAPALASVTHKNMGQILAAAKILEACTFYVLLKDLISLRRHNFMENLNRFLIEHLSEDLSVERLMEEFHVSRSRLYEAAGKYLGCGIAEHIKNLRLKEARRLLRETDYPVYQISDRVGFNDYNYFCRVFKQKNGISAKKYRYAAIPHEKTPAY